MFDAFGRASYAATFEAFRNVQAEQILGHLTLGEHGDVVAEQRSAWMRQIGVLKDSLPEDVDGLICFEMVIPRIGRRADNVLLIGDQVLVLEFKVGAQDYAADAKRQVMDYALDLKNFHEGSRAALITPVLVATAAPMQAEESGPAYGDVFPVALANQETLRHLLRGVAQRARMAVAPHQAWLESGYRPTPTIIEASKALYAGHQVRDITHSEAGAGNLGLTTTALAGVIEHARRTSSKTICLVSGVPGAGKTLAGLNLICEQRRADTEHEDHAVFLSGNGPLVRVLQEALARDTVARSAERGIRVNKSAAHRETVSFVQNIHHFRDESLKSQAAPVERVVVFDEAQRAWNRAQASKFMRTKRGHQDFNASEPEFLIGVMDRHSGWAVIVCLIGGGQEINTGEAGLEEWLRALRDHFPHWHVCLPEQLEAADDLAHFDISELASRVTRMSALHLSVSLRSFRSEQLSDGVSALMSGDAGRASSALQAVLPKFPIVITRSLDKAKVWIRSRARGNERFGLLASSGAKRLKPVGLNMDIEIDPCVWFLNDNQDVRSSLYLEDAASEFDVQGLELDWAAVVWDGDLIHQQAGWRFRAFKGTRWQEIRDGDARRYRLNAYRVLLTRARQGMVIVVPTGSTSDLTRAPEFYDPTWEFLRSIGLQELA